MSPYIGKTFFGFLKALIMRGGPLVADELQLLTFIAVGISCTLSGTFLVLRRGAMLANALSHTVLLGLVVAFWLFGTAAQMDMSVLISAALLTALLSTGLTYFLERGLRMQREAAIALVFTALFSLGVALTGWLTKNLHMGTESISGSGDLLGIQDLKMALLLLGGSMSLLALCYKSLVLSTFDATFAASTGTRVRFLHIALMCQSAGCIVVSFRCVGVVMALAFFIAPPLFARLFARHLMGALCIASVFVIAASLIGSALARHLLTAYHLPVSTGALVATLLTVGTLIALVSKKSTALFARK